MRILFFIHELALNGAVTALLQQVRLMRARGDLVTVFTPPLTGHAAALEGAFREAGALLRHDSIQIADYDVAVGCTIFASDHLSQVVKHMPTVWWIHEGALGVNFMMSKVPARSLLAQVNKLVFPSRGTVEHIWSPLLRGVPVGRVDIVGAGIKPSEAGPQIARNGEAARVLCVGSIYPRKRQIDLAQAVLRLQGRPLECVLVGDQSSMDDITRQQLATAPERFVLTGGLAPEQAQAWYRSSDVFCLPSSDESMPISALEAASHGVPVVLSDLDCYDGVWRHGVNALLYPVGDIDLLAWNLRILLESAPLRARLGAAARRVALRFSEARAGSLFEAALLEAIAAFKLGV